MAVIASSEVKFKILERHGVKVTVAHSNIVYHKDNFNCPTGMYMYVKKNVT